jgi:putative FmdB family regulatory protein
MPKKYKYEYKCPDCGTEIELKMRTTQTKRRCPHCGKEVLTSEIDKQEEDKRKQQALMVAGVVVVVVIIALLSGVKNVWNWLRE